MFPNFMLGVYDLTNTGIFLLSSDAIGGLPDTLPAEGVVSCVTEAINLTPGRCYVNVALYKSGAQADYVTQAAYFDVEPDDVYGSGKIPPRDWFLNVIGHTWSTGEELSAS
jgi:lipopolysaccharide transport system ATP-binding protein